MAFLENLVAMLIFGTIGLFVKQLTMPSATLALLRTFIGAIVLGIAILVRKKKISIAPKEGKYLLLSAFFLGCNWVFLFESYRYTSVSNATIIYYSAPIMILLFSYFVNHQKISKKTIVSMMITMLGLCLLMLQSVSFALLGIGFGLLAALGYAGIVLTNRKIHMDALPFTFLQLSLAALLLLVYNGMKGSLPHIAQLQTGWTWILVLGVLHTGLAYLLYFSSIAKLKPSIVAMLSYVDPCTAVFLSIFVLQEGSSPMQLLGIFCMITGIVFSQQGRDSDVL